MIYKPVNLSDLRWYLTHENAFLDVYPGGSSSPDRGALRRYIQRKKVVERATGLEMKATDVYDRCSYFKTQNMMRAEDDLLKKCSNARCPFNAHRLSNLRPDPGFVYVLHSGW